MHWNKKVVSLSSPVSRHARNSPIKIGKAQDRQGTCGHHSITVHGTKRLYSKCNGLEDVLVFQCAVFCDLAGGGQFGNSTGGGGCRLQVRVGQCMADDRHIPTKGFAFLAVPAMGSDRDRPSGLLPSDLD